MTLDQALKRIKTLEAALRPFAEAHRAQADHIGDSDLYDEQPRTYYKLTLGDWRRAGMVLPLRSEHCQQCGIEAPRHDDECEYGERA